MSIFKTLAGITGEKNVMLNEPMKNHTSFRTGGEADIFVSPDSINSLKDVIKLFREKDIPFYIFGNGSNMLVSDRGIEGAVIHIGNGFSSIEVKENKITSGAGAILSAVSNAAFENSLTGFEFASGIPGSIGGGVVMNAGAYDGELGQIVTKVWVMIEEGEILVLNNQDMEFGYRTSVIKKRPFIVVQAEIELQPGNKEEIAAKMTELNRRRRDKQPLQYPSAGSTFKRPQGYFAGKLIMDAGLRGYSIGGACVSEKHCGFIINKNHASAADVAEVICEVQERVKEKFGVTLETEVILLGDF